MKLTFTGDILIYESQDKHCRDTNGKYNYKPIFEQVKKYINYTSNYDFIIKEIYPNNELLNSLINVVEDKFNKELEDIAYN